MLEGFKDPRLGDGYCDDIFNWDVCDFDHGDCCPSLIEPKRTSVNTMFCEDCFCLQSYPVQDSCYFADFVGNGICDDLANTQACSYDGGDCCSTDPKAFKNCKHCQCLYDPRELMSSSAFFPQDKCSHQSSQALGDGYCHDELNNPACNYDNGDCCSPTVFTNVCRQCKCHLDQSLVKKREKKECGLLSQADLEQLDRCEDHLNIPECDYSNQQCCGKANMHYCDDCACLDPRNTDKRDISRCPFLGFKGNGLCDDANNIPECDYDGGDCCGHFMVKGHCQMCACLDEEMLEYQQYPQWKCKPELMYDGVCDLQNKVSSCRFDGFDCEVSTLCQDPSLLQNRQCDPHVNVSQCAFDMGDCLKSDDKGNEYLCLDNVNLQSDGLCDLLNNVKECDYDGGDCLVSRGTNIFL